MTPKGPKIERASTRG